MMGQREGFFVTGNSGWLAGKAGKVISVIH